MVDCSVRVPTERVSSSGAKNEDLHGAVPPDTKTPKSGGTDRLAVACRRALVPVLLCTALAVIASSDALYSGLLWLLTSAEAIIRTHPVSGIVVFVVFAALSAMLAFVSTAVITPVAIHTWGEPLSMLLLWSGWTLGGVCAYGVGRFLGRPAVTSLTSSTALTRWEDRISTHAPFGLVLLFQVALPSEVPGYVLGLLRYHFARFVLALALAELPFAVATIYLGVSFLERRILAFLGLGALVALFSVWAFYTLQKRLSGKGETRRSNLNQ
jgi:uncharacterized membrane protein YdjX (TVP38/TMEM64 family)